MHGNPLGPSPGGQTPRGQQAPPLKVPPIQPLERKSQSTPPPGLRAAPVDSAWMCFRRVMTTPQGTGAPTNLCPDTDTLPMGFLKVTMGARLTKGICRMLWVGGVGGPEGTYRCMHTQASSSATSARAALLPSVPGSTSPTHLYTPLQSAHPSLGFRPLLNSPPNLSLIPLNVTPNPPPKNLTIMPKSAPSQWM